jgi:hypothetical protein
VIETQRAENEKVAQTAVSKFDETARAAGLSAESHLLRANLATAADMFARLARRFDISVLAQAEPDRMEFVGDLIRQIEMVGAQGSKRGASGQCH